MRRNPFAVPTLVFAVLASSLGCSNLLPLASHAATSSRGASAASASDNKPSAAVVAAARAQQGATMSRAEASLDEMLAREEKSALKALNMSLGKASAIAGQPPPEPSSAAALALRKSPVKVRLERVTDADGNVMMGDNFLQLKDSYTERMLVLQRKFVEHTASKAEMKEARVGAKYIMKVSDLRTAVDATSIALQKSSSTVQTVDLTCMVLTVMMMRSHQEAGMALDADDYARVKRNLERARRAEAIAASTMGMLAAYQAVLNDGADPKGLAAVAERSVAAFPIAPSVTDEEARKYVAGLDDDLDAQKPKYEQMMRKTYGDAQYEQIHKQQLDATFRMLDGMPRRQTMAPAAAPAPGAAPALGAGPASATAALDPSRLAPTRVKKGLAQVANGVDVATAAKNGDVAGALDGATKMFPADQKVGSALGGLSALAKGDPRGAFDAALSLAPASGPVKEGLGVAFKLLFGGGDKG